MNVNGFSKYVSDGKSVFTKDRRYPLAPSIHPTKKFTRFFMVDDAGMEHAVSVRVLNSIVDRSSSPAETTPLEKQIKVDRSSPVENKTRGKRVLNRSTGEIYGSIKSAADAVGMTVNKIKSNKDFEIIG